MKLYYIMAVVKKSHLPTATMVRQKISPYLDWLSQ